MTTRNTRPLLKSVALFSRRRYRLLFWFTAAAVLVSVLLASRLRFDTDVLNLLPRQAPEVNRLREALEEFGSLDYLILVVRVPEGVHLEPYEAFTDRLGQSLEELDVLRQVDYKLGELDELLETFLPQSLLFLDADGRRQLGAKLGDEALEERARELRRLVATPQALALKSMIRLDPLGISEIFLGRLTRSRAGLSIDWTSGYLLSRDRRMLLLLAQPVEPPQDVAFARRLMRQVEERIEDARRAWPELAGPGDSVAPEVVLGGRYVIAVGDEKVIRRDVVINVLTSMAGVLALFLFAFRRFGPLLYAFVPLCCGLALTFGFSAVLYGSLSAATSGVAALLIGLGIDFIIVSYGRFVEERSRGADLETALEQMSGSSGRAVVVGAVTSAATFYSFGVTDFTGLFQMGYLTGTGILFCMAAVLLLLPAMLAWHEDHHRRRAREPRLFLHGLGTGRLIEASIRRPRTVLALSLIVSVAAGTLASRLEFNDSVQSMRPAGNQGGAIRDEVADRFGAGFEQMMLILEGDTLDEVLELTDRATSGAKQLLQEGVLTGYDSVISILPPPAQQRSNLAWLDTARRGELDMVRIRETFSRAARQEGLRPEAFAAGFDLMEGAMARRTPIEIEELRKEPHTASLLKRYLLRRDGGWRAVLYLSPPPKIWRREAPPEVKQLAADLGPRAVLTGANVVSEFLRKRVLKDAMIAAALGFVLVAFLLWLDYRRLSDTFLSLAPLMMGILWMLGGMKVLGLSMNFMNIFVATMIIGIGVDYGVHMIHRHRELSGRDEATLQQGLRETGKAIVLAALSTVVGFGSLSLSHYPGLRSMGQVAILGALSSALVAITVLPAFLWLRRRSGGPASGWFVGGRESGRPSR